ncbi:hypothetical protein CDAR_440261 [Caerostris darwini]|uniref:Uncharacterized protein n=1 Tax=Caerostris darwini TaxID=1538125 RepID=A0AAV4RXD3_9ARAC|nr:hypothetical protein CDAR_440261 [Caerostris darwini]
MFERKLIKVPRKIEQFDSEDYKCVESSKLRKRPPKSMDAPIEIQGQVHCDDDDTINNFSVHPRLKNLLKGFEHKRQQKKNPIKCKKIKMSVKEKENNRGRSRRSMKNQCKKGFQRVRITKEENGALKESYDDNESDYNFDNGLDDNFDIVPDNEFDFSYSFKNKKNYLEKEMAKKATVINIFDQYNKPNNYNRPDNGEEGEQNTTDEYDNEEHANGITDKDEEEIYYDDRKKYSDKEKNFYKEKQEFSDTKDKQEYKNELGSLGKYFVYVNCTNCKIKSQLVILGSKSGITGTDVRMAEKTTLQTASKTENMDHMETTEEKNRRKREEEGIKTTEEKTTEMEGKNNREMTNAEEKTNLQIGDANHTISKKKSALKTENMDDMMNGNDESRKQEKKQRRKPKTTQMERENNREITNAEEKKRKHEIADMETTVGMTEGISTKMVAEEKTNLQIGDANHTMSTKKSALKTENMVDMMNGNDESRKQEKKQRRKSKTTQMGRENNREITNAEEKKRKHEIADMETTVGMTEGISTKMVAEEKTNLQIDDANHTISTKKSALKTENMDDMMNGNDESRKQEKKAKEKAQNYTNGKGKQ